MLRKKALQLLAWLICASVAVTFAGCVNDDIEVKDVEVPSGHIKINFTVPEMSVASRATSAENYECALKDVHIIFFNEAGAYVAHSHADVKDGQTSFVFKIPDKLKVETDYKTLVVGNSHNYTPKSYSTFDQYVAALVEGSNYDRVRKELVAEGGVLTKTSAGSAGLPMYGTFTDNGGIAIPFRFTGSAAEGYSVAGKVDMNRLVSRIDINNLMGSRLVITKVKLGNRRNGAYYFNHSLLHPEVSLDASYTPMGSVQSGETDVIKTQLLTGELYCFSNMVPVTVQNDETTTFVLIEGYYQDGVAPNTSTLSYYRVNLAEVGKPQQLQPNHIYRLNITNVEGAGASTEEGAISATAPKIGYSINDVWIDDDDNTLVSDNKGNTLSISRANLQFAYEKESAQLVRIKATGSQPLQWHAAKVTDDINYPDHDKFEMTANGTSGIAVVPVSDNTSPYMYRARIKVWATGGTVDATNPPTTYIDVFQFNKSGEMRILTVDNQVGTIEATMPGQGGTMRFVINTGSRDAGYQASWLSGKPLGANIINNGLGNNGSTLEVFVPINSDEVIRHFSIVVKRVENGVIADSDPNPVIIEFTQPVTTKLYETVYPLSEDVNNPTLIEGFREDVDITKSYRFSNTRFPLSFKIYDDVNYELEITSNFLGTDLVLLSNTTDNNGSLSKTLTSSNQQIYAVPMATGPGDPTLVRSISVIVRNKKTKAFVDRKEYYLGITTSCQLGDVTIPSLTTGQYLLLADRNVGVPKFSNGEITPALFCTPGTQWGASQSSISSATKIYQPSYGENVTNQSLTEFVSTRYVCNNISTDVLKDDYAQPWFENINDAYYFYSQSNISKWTWNYNINLTSLKFGFSKGRAYILSSHRRMGKPIGCWLATMCSYNSYSSSTNYAQYIVFFRFASYDTLGHIYYVSPSNNPNPSIRITNTLRPSTSNYTGWDGAPIRMAYPLKAEEIARYEAGEI